MEFDYSDLVSTRSQDSLEVQVKKELLSLEPSYALETDEDLMFNHQIEPIDSADFLETIAEIADTAEDYLQAFFGANIVLSLFTSAFLQRLWGLVNAL